MITKKYAFRSINDRYAVYGYVGYSEKRTLYYGVSYYILGIRIWFKCLFQEELPGWAESQLVFLGSTEWKSKCSKRLRKKCVNKENYHD